MFGVFRRYGIPEQVRNDEILNQYRVGARYDVVQDDVVRNDGKVLRFRSKSGMTGRRISGVGKTNSANYAREMNFLNVLSASIAVRTSSIGVSVSRATYDAV